MGGRPEAAMMSNPGIPAGAHTMEASGVGKAMSYGGSVSLGRSQGDEEP